MPEIALYAEAEDELAGAIAFYEKQEPGLGASFLKAVEDSFDQILSRPHSFPIVAPSDVRRTLTERFPYIIVYRIEGDTIIIIAVFHTSREPDVWRGRIG